MRAKLKMNLIKKNLTEWLQFLRPSQRDGVQHRDGIDRTRKPSVERVVLQLCDPDKHSNEIDVNINVKI